MALTKEALLKLQNGSDIRGVAIDGVEGQPVTLTAEAINLIAGSFVRWLAGKCGKRMTELKISVGHDSRISASALKNQVLHAIVATGATAYDCGLASTPSMFMSVVYPETLYDGAIMITASHLPFNRNGLKFFDAQGGLEKEDITTVLEGADRNPAATADISRVLKVNLLSLYARSLREKIRMGVQAEDYEHPLSGLHVIVDAGNGAGGFFARDVLQLLGADTSGSQFLEPDGNFPNHIPNPEDPGAMQSIRKAVLDNGADLGLIFDTDVDRMSAVLGNGDEINRDGIIAMMAAVLAPENPGGTIVTDSVTSDKLTAFLEGHLHLKHHRFKRGYKNVINECKRLNLSGISSPLAIETSGHGALKENYYLDDGAYLAVKLLIAAAKLRAEDKKLDELIAAMEKPYESREIRMTIAGDDFSAYGKEVLTAFETSAKEAGITVVPNSYEGVRLSFANGWALLRLSLHDPLMPLNVEGLAAGDCDEILGKVRALLAPHDRLGGLN